MKILTEAAGGASALARLVGISEGTVRKYINGLSEPARDILVTIADHTQTSIEWLVSGTGEQHKPSTFGLKIPGKKIPISPEYQADLDRQYKLAIGAIKHDGTDPSLVEKLMAQAGANNKGNLEDLMKLARKLIKTYADAGIGVTVAFATRIAADEYEDIADAGITGEKAEGAMEAIAARHLKAAKLAFELINKKD